MKRAPVILTTAVLGLALTACAGRPLAEQAEQTQATEPVPAATETPEKPEGMSQEEWEHHLEYAETAEPYEANDEPIIYPTGQDYWFVSDSETIGKLSLSGEPVAEYEELRESVGADPVTYLTVDVDNRQGLEGANMYQVLAYDESGREYEFNGIDDQLNEWQSTIDTDAYYSGEPGEGEAEMELYDQFTGAEIDAGDYANVGQVQRFVMTSDDTELPAEFTHVTVHVHGADHGTSIFPADLAELNGVDLDFEVPAQQ